MSGTFCMFCDRKAVHQVQRVLKVEGSTRPELRTIWVCNHHKQSRDIIVHPQRRKP